MFQLRDSTIMRIIPLLIAVCLAALPAQTDASGAEGSTPAPRTGRYAFLPDQSALVQTGGIAGVYRTYRVEGQFLLSFDPNTQIASFIQVDANATDDSPYRRTLDPNAVFVMTSLTGTVVSETTFQFTGKAADGSDVLVTATLRDNSVHVVAETTPPPGSADFFVFSMDATAQRKYAGGTGQLGDPYQIATAADLMALGNEPNDYAKCFILTADIDLDPNLPGNRVFDRALIAADVFYSAGKSPGPAFTGVLDGQGHAIVGMVVASNGPFAGLFGTIGSGGCVYNLRLVGGSVRGQALTSLRDGVTGGAGSLAGVSQGVITGCSCTGSVSGTHYVGGLVGCNSIGSVSACYSTSPVNSTGWDIGGLVGNNEGGTISACYSMGAVSGVGDVGGLVGWNSGSICACYSVGSVNSMGSSVGGLLGYNVYGGTISACFWDTQTSGRAMSAGGTGGLNTIQMKSISTFVNAGWDFLGEKANGLCEYWQMPMEGGYPVLSVFSGYVPPTLRGRGTADDPYLMETAGDLGTVWHRPTACYQLAADLDLSGIRWGMAVIPGFCGRLYGNGHRIRALTIAGGGHLALIGVLCQGAVVSDLGLKDVNDMSMGDYIGALVGLNGGTISACYSTGSVIGLDRVGGLVGFNTGPLISACYSTGSVSGSSAVGGLVGYNFTAGTISACYSTLSVSGHQDVGGLVGKNAVGKILACFWDTQTSGTTASSGGTGMTTAEMKTAKTFLDAGWDLAGETDNGTEDIWWIDEGKDYPRLWWEKSDGASQF